MWYYDNMAGDSSPQEVQISSKALENGHSRWGWLQRIRSPFRKPETNHHGQISQPANQEKAQVIAGSGYAKLIEELQLDSKERNDYLAQILQDEYEDLISAVKEDGNVRQEVRSGLVDEINKGNKAVIAVVAARLFEKMGGEVKLRSRGLRKDPLLSSKLPKVKHLMDAMQSYFIRQELAKDQSNRMDAIKEDWARNHFYQATKNPNWLPVQQVSVPPGVEHAFVKAGPNVLDPSLPAK